MAITYSELFADIGKFVKTIDKFHDAARSLAASEPDLDALLDEIRTQLELTGRQDLTDGLESMFDGFRSANSAAATTVAAEVTKRLLHRETVINQLPGAFEGDITRTLGEIYRDMVQNSQTINSSSVTIAAPVAFVSNVGNGTVYTTKILDGVSAPSTNMPSFLYYRGQESQLAVPSERLSLTCVADEDTDGTPEGQEIFLLEGQPASNGAFGWKSEGSGVSLQMSTAQAANLISNQNLETWTSNVPVNWIAEEGTPGVHFVQETEALDVFRGLYALKLVGATDSTRIIQSIPVGVLQPNRHYFFAAYIKAAGVTSGDLTIQLESPSGGYTAGGSEKVFLNAAALGALANYTPQTFWLMMPASLPDDLRLVIRHQSSPDGEIWIDSMALAPVVYANGVGFVLLAADEQFTRGDRFTVDVTSTEGVFQRFFRRRYQRQLPNSGTPTIADALAT